MTYTGVSWLVATMGLPEHRDEHGLPYYLPEEIAQWQKEHNYTGSRARGKRFATQQREKLRRAKGMSNAMAMMAEGKERLEILITLGIPSDWVDDAYAEYSLTLESAQDAKLVRDKAKQDAFELKEHAAAQRNLERMMIKDLKKRRR